MPGKLHPGAVFKGVHRAILSPELDDATSSPHESCSYLQCTGMVGYRLAYAICKIYDWGCASREIFVQRGTRDKTASENGLKAMILLAPTGDYGHCTRTVNA